MLPHRQNGPRFQTSAVFKTPALIWSLISNTECAVPPSATLVNTQYARPLCFVARSLQNYRTVKRKTPARTSANLLVLSYIRHSMYSCSLCPPFFGPCLCLCPFLSCIQYASIQRCSAVPSLSSHINSVKSFWPQWLIIKQCRCS